MIHPTAIVHPRAKLDATVQVGPFAVIDADVTLGAQCIVGPHVYLTGVTTIGAHNRFHAGCVIGDAPQDLKYRDEPTWVRIGDHNVFREHVTVQRATTANAETAVGSHNFLMANCHVGHNSRLGNNIIIANGALLGGHVTVQDRAFISGNCLVHQFTRIGTLVMMQGGSAAGQDVPPFTIVSGINTLCGLNVVGLRRAGLTAAQRLELKQLYRALFRSGKNLGDALAAAQVKFTGPAAKSLLEFIADARHGVCRDGGRVGGEDE